jgi:3-oxoacyl-[acyl-carrier protein] reductase
MSLAAPGSLSQGSSTDVLITRDAVHRFARLTGDRSSLHVDDAFARRTAYRQAVVHGMLTVACAATLPSLRVPGFRAVPVALTGRFSAPVVPGDFLRIVGGAARVHEGGRFEIPYTIAREQLIAARGTLTVVLEPEQPPQSPPAASDVSTLLAEDLELNHSTFEQIAADARDGFQFTVTDAAVAELQSILATSHRGVSDLTSMKDHVYLPNLLAAVLYSTSVGVSLPGAWATFLEFACSLERRIDCGVPYALKGRITHRSVSTRIVKKELIIETAAGDVVARGTASALVAAPPSRMPSSHELAQTMGLGLEGRVVLITGASRGIGETTAKLFALHGSRVIVNYHRGAEDAARVVREITAAGGDAIAVGADVSDAGQVGDLCRRACDQYGTIDVLVNNAARDFRPVPFLNLSWENIQNDLDIIVRGAFHCCQAVLPLMLARGGGRIVNVSSVAVDNPPPDQTKYVVAKSALVGLTRSLSIEFASRNIQVNLVVPNFVETDFVGHVPEGFRRKIAREIPMQRAAAPSEVARAIVFLASNHASFTTGQKVMVTGGGAPYL